MEHNESKACFWNWSNLFHVAESGEVKVGKPRIPRIGTDSNFGVFNAPIDTIINILIKHPPQLHVSYKKINSLNFIYLFIYFNFPTPTQ